MAPRPERRRRRIGWIGGWGINPKAFAAAVEAAWPQGEHIVVAPGEQAVPQLLDRRCDLLAGYSLGSLLLFAEGNALSATMPLVAVAPIVAFCAEAGRGGTSPRATLQALQLRFERDPLQALKTYFRLARLADEPGDALPYARADLAWGLEALGRLEGRPESVARSRRFVGGQDRLLDFTTLEAQAAGQHLIPTAGHDYRDLLPEVARHV